MYIPNHRFFMDIGIGVVGMYLGGGIAFLSFIIVVLIEARIMKRYFSLPRRPRILYSLIINTISTLVGFPLVYWIGINQRGGNMMSNNVYTDLLIAFTYYAGFPPLVLGYFNGLLVTFAATIFIEYFCLIALLRQKLLLKKSLRFAILSNSISYMALLIVPPIAMIGIALVVMLLSA